MFTRSPKTSKASSSAFGSIPAKELAVLEAHSTSVNLSQGRVVVRQGDPGREAFLVISGALSVERDNEPVAVVGPGALVGELALLHNEPRTATVIAASDAQVLALNRREFATVLDSCPTLAARLLGEAADRTESIAA